MSINIYSRWTRTRNVIRILNDITKLMSPNISIISLDSMTCCVKLFFIHSLYF